MRIIKPFQDELLSSWIFRLSKVNYTGMSSLLNYIFKSKNLHLKDIDIFRFNLNSLNHLSNLTKIPTEKLQSMQLLKYEGYIEEKINYSLRHRWFTPNKKSGSSNTFFAIRFCPLCLQENLYLKQHWRVLFFNICPKHHVYLMNRCTKCQQEIKYPNNNYHQELFECHNCKNDLRLCKTEKIKKKSKLLLYQNMLLNISATGYYKLNNRYYYSIGLFYLLRILIKNIMKAKKINTLYYIEQLEPKTLSFLVSYSLFLLKRFPYRLNNFYSKYRFTNLHKILDKYQYKSDLLPNWFLSSIQYNRKIK
jgi:hypothetical protein